MVTGEGTGPLYGVLFDSGDTLIRPIGGRWNPRHDFEAVVLRHHPGIPSEAFATAFAACRELLDAAAGTASRSDYHQVILRELGVLRPSAALLSRLEEPLHGPPVVPFPEVRTVLEALQARRVRMVIGSDNWPNLPDLYRQLDLDAFFEAYVISAEVGCRKPDPRMYRAGSDALGLQPHECLFVDDDRDLVRAALALGYRGIAVHRGTEPPPNIPFVTSLSDLPALLAP